MKRKSLILGCGSYLPTRIVTNDELTLNVDTSDAWISRRTGIKQRHIAEEGETSASLGAAAAHLALADSGLSTSAVDAIIVATSTPDDIFPATATHIQAQLGLHHGFAFDIQAACTGFIYALTVANSMICSEQAETILVIGTETLSRILDWDDRNSCVLFGDGAGAVLLAADKGPPAIESRGIISCHLFSDGRHRDLLHSDGDPLRTNMVGYLRMQGREVFRYAVEKLEVASRAALDAHHLDPTCLSWLVPHQANLRIIEATAQRIGLSMDRVIMTVDRHANTSAASIPLALAEARKDGRICDRDLILIEAMGAGFTWGSALLRW